MTDQPLNIDDDEPRPDSFETATPVTLGGDEHAGPTARFDSPVIPSEPASRAEGRIPRAAPDRAPPHSPEAEEHVLACCLLDEGATLQRALDQGITPDSFYSPANRLLFEIITNLPRPVSLEVLAAELQTRRQLESIGGFPYLMQVTGKIPTTAHAGYMIAKVRELSALRDTIKAATRTVEEAYGYTGGLEEFLKSAEARMARIRGKSPVEKAKPSRSITSYAYPSDDDPDIILGSDDYLGRGGGLLFVSHAGAGKSSWAMDACMMWALGRAWMQIKSHQPRKTLIIQAEDSDRYIGKIFTSFAHANNLTEQDLELLTQNCIIVRLKGVSGPAFFTALTALTLEHQPDLVVINPIYLYAEGDITRSEFAQPFLLGLDAVNRAEKWAYILIHHTGKPQAKGNNGKRAEVEDWESAYMGFGSSYLANWPRATILLEPVSGNPGHYQIKLGKGGLNAGVTKMVEQGAGLRSEPCTRISIRHSAQRMTVNGKDKPVYYWEMDDSAPVAEVAPKGGKPKQYHFSKFTSIFPTARDKAEGRRILHRKAEELAPIKDTAFREMLFQAVEDGELMRLSNSTGFSYYLAVPGAT